MQQYRLFTTILLTLISIAFVTLVPHMGIVPFPFGYTAPILLFIWIFLKGNKENFADIGFSFSSITVHAFLIGTLTAVLLFAITNYAVFPLLEKWAGLQAANLGDFEKIKDNTGFYLFMILMGWIVGGFYEEIVFHGFIFTRIEKILPARFAVITAFWLSNLVFASYHYQLGMAGVINAMIAGVVYHALMLRYKRNMWYAIVCHAVFDTIALTYIYAGIG